MQGLKEKGSERERKTEEGGEGKERERKIQRERERERERDGVEKINISCIDRSEGPTEKG